MSDGRSGDETESHAIVDDGPPVHGAVDLSAAAPVAPQSAGSSSNADPGVGSSSAQPAASISPERASPPAEAAGETVHAPLESVPPPAADVVTVQAQAGSERVAPSSDGRTQPVYHVASAGTPSVADGDVLETVRLEPPPPAIPVDDPPSDVRRWHLPLLILLGFLALLILALLNSTLGLWQLPGSLGTIPTRELILSSTPLGDTGISGWPPGNLDPGGNIPLIGVPGDPALVPGATFAEAYERAGGLRILGLPLTGPVWVNGREIQWFERARLEHWPEHAGTPFEVQLGLLGVEFTQGRTFARQQFFVSRPDLRYFPETGHGVGGRFLRFWEENGDLIAFGLPISEEFDEVMPDGLAYRVQYFERVRMEYHPQYAGSPYEVQLG
ncbi:MAG: hypothetical protein EOM24_19820, partial [Chloroflexia bacterium]|nr:hypothetical protein [Chloroflexia bacterium]